MSRTRPRARALPAALALVLALAPAVGCGAPEREGGAARRAPATARLRVQSGYGLSVPLLGEQVRHLEQLLAAEGDGVALRVYDVDQLVKPLQIFDAVAAGKIDAGYAFPGYWMGKIPAAAVFAAIPFGPEAPEYLAWVYEGGGLEIWREIYAKRDVVPVPCGVLPPEASGWFREPVRSVEDLRGMKIRFAGLGGKVLQRLGASITMLAAGDLFLALERGVLDATEYSVPAVDRPLGFHEVAKHYYFPGWHQPSSLLELLVHAPTWEGLAPAQRERIETACAATALYGLARGPLLQEEALAFYREQGVEIHRWPPEILARLREEARAVMEATAAEDAEFARAWRSLRRFRERVARWDALAVPE